jgi:predicted flap endonuclease-1-like 5' DNA nuclease
MAVLSSKSFSLDNPKTRANKGKLIRVTLPAGNIVKMYTQDAIAAGYIKAPQNKAMPAPAENKMMPIPAANKAQEDAAPAEQAVDFSTIKGVGLASARLIVANGIGSYEQLRTADISFLPGKVQQAIEEWRND